MSSAPVCNVNPPAQPFAQKPAQFVPIPAATDLQSGLRAINAMRQNFQLMYNYLTTNNILIEPFNPQFISSIGAQQQKTKANAFKETSRQTKTTRIFDPNNHDNFIDVEQVTSLTLQDQATKQTWTFNQ